MNKDDRTQLESIVEILDEEKVNLEVIQGDLQDRADNTEEYFPGSERGEKLQEESDNIQEAIDNIEMAIDGLNEVQ